MTMTTNTQPSRRELLARTACLAAAGVAVVAGADASPAQVLALYALTGALQPCDPGAVRLAYVRPPDAKVPKGMSLVGPPPGPSR